MNDNEPQNDPWIPARFGSLAAAVLGVLGTMIIWVGTQAINLDDRIDRLESDINHLIDKNGEIRASRGSVEALREIAAMRAELNDLKLLVSRCQQQ